MRAATLPTVPALVVHTLPRATAQAAVGRVPLRDVLLSLKRQRIIVRFRLRQDVVVVEAERVLGLFFDGGLGES